MCAREPMDRQELEQTRRLRRHPRRTQFDYLHLKRLVDGLAEVLERVGRPESDVLDVFCGSRPYEDLLPPGSRCVGLDVTDEFGVADVVTDEFLPFGDDSFDLVISTEAFYYVRDPRHGVSELRRVLRPGGAVVLTVPLVWEYDRTLLEHRFTGPELEELFEGWEGVEVIENGGRAVAWALLGGVLLRSIQRRALRRRLPGGAVNRAFALLYAANNTLGARLDRVEAAYDWGSRTLPANVMLVARAPRAGA
jgi:SAM-dependent methyltransferase